MIAAPTVVTVGSCGPCLCGQHSRCIPTVKSDKGWLCACHQADHPRKARR